MSFSVGSTVALSESVRRVCTNSEKFQTGTVMKIHSWGVVEVQWNGTEHPILMREDELKQIDRGDKE